MIEKIYHMQMKPWQEKQSYEEMKTWLHGTVDPIIKEFIYPLPAAIDFEDMSCEEAAIALYGALCDQSLKQGQSPAFEVLCLTPELEHFGKCEEGRWRVYWESGPYYWAVALSGGQIPLELDGMPTLKNITRANNLFMEPYYGFDISFQGAQ